MDAVDVKGARVLVTGASGFIGGRLCRRLVEGGAEVHAVRWASPLRDGAGLVEHRLDLTDEKAAGELYESVRPEVVFNLASRVAGARDLELLLPTFHANLAAAVYLMAAAARHGCRRFVQIGSLEEPEGEATAVPSSPYAAGKWAASGYGRMCHALYGLPIVFARLFMVYGPGQHDLKKLIPYTILSLARGATPSFSSGSRPVDWVYVDDVVEGLLRLATAPGLEGRRLDLGSGTLHTVRQVVETLFALLAPGTSPSFGGREDRIMEQVRKADLEATEKHLGWRPATPLEAGLRATVDWYLNAHPSGRQETP
ncbi:MAG: NAD(P)-dependent oxidoreductase [Acidobacteria bacterium]|nr:MAG: NAD(P)-dependent oxidoreductase [Acidobacteriota bacterium]